MAGYTARIVQKTKMAYFFGRFWVQGAPSFNKMAKKCFLFYRSAIRIGGCKSTVCIEKDEATQVATIVEVCTVFGCLRELYHISHRPQTDF